MIFERKGVRGYAPYKLIFQVPASGEFEKLEPNEEHRQCLLFLSRIIDKNSYHDF